MESKLIRAVIIKKNAFLLMILLFEDDIWLPDDLYPLIYCKSILDQRVNHSIIHNKLSLVYPASPSKKGPKNEGTKMLFLSLWNLFCGLILF
jgi:hypothetical protein